MYAQEILTDLGDLRWLTGNPWDTQNYRDYIKESAEIIKKSHKFHMGSYDDLYKLSKNLIEKPEMKLNADYVKMPYKYSYFDFTVTTETGGTDRLAMCFWESETDPDFLAYLSFQYDKANIKKWMLRPIAYIIHTRGMLPRKEFFRRARIAFPDRVGNDVKDFRKDIEELLCLMGSLVNVKDLSQYQRAEALEETFFWAVTMFLLMLYSKNVGTNEINPSKKKGKTGFGSRKLPMFTYHVLKLNLPKKKGEKEKNMNANEAMKHYRKHFCRGHFKVYTEDAPLLGKFVGRYWFSAHLRGSEDGFVDKDYKAVINQ